MTSSVDELETDFATEFLARASLADQGEDESPLKADPNHYRAFERTRAGSCKMLELRFDGESYGVAYAYLRATRFERKDGSHRLALYTATGRVSLYGRDLEELNALVMAHKIVWIQQFYPHRVARLVPGQPLVELIEFQVLPE